MRRARQGEDRLARLLHPLQGWPAVRDAATHSAVLRSQFGDLLGGLPRRALRLASELLEQWPERRPALADIRVVALEHQQLRHRAARHRLALARLPVAHLPQRLGDLIRRVVQQRRRDQVPATAEVALGQARELDRDPVKRVPVRLGLPRRRDRLVERVYERVQVRRGQVVLLIPRRRRQHDIGEQRVRGHPKVDRRQQVELALRRLLAPHDIARTQLRRGLLRPHRAVGHPEQVLEEVLVPLARGAEQVRAPHRHHLRVVLRRVGVLAREPQPPRAQLPHDVLGRSDPLTLGLVHQLQRAAIKARIRRQPPQPGAERVHVEDVAAGEQPPPQRRGQVLGLDPLVAPLVGGDVEERRPRLMARRAHPVERERDRLPARQRAHLLLTDVVRPAAAVPSLAAAHHHQRQERPVDLIGVEPVVGARAHADHRAPLGHLGVAGELARHPRRQMPIDAGDLLLPGRRARLARRRRSPPASRPAAPRAPTPYCASARSSTVVTSCPPIRIAGTPRRTLEPPSLSPTSKRGRSTATRSCARSSSVSAGTIPSRRRFQRPSSLAA